MKKKALHDEDGRYYSFLNGEIIVWGVDDVAMLLNAANDAPKYEAVEKGGFTLLMKNGVVVTRVPPEDEFCTTVHDWMCDLLDDGVTDELIDELNGALADIRYLHLLVSSGDRPPHWKFNIADMNRPLSVEEAAAYAFSQQLAIAALEGLRRCQLPDCERFFIGRPNSKWCSSSCGSKFRVRRKRKRDLK